MFGSSSSLPPPVGEEGRVLSASVNNLLSDHFDIKKSKQDIIVQIDYSPAFARVNHNTLYALTSGYWTLRVVYSGIISISDS